MAMPIDSASFDQVHTRSIMDSLVFDMKPFFNKNHGKFQIVHDFLYIEQGMYILEGFICLLSF